MLCLIEPSLLVLDAMTKQIRALEKFIEEMAMTKYPEREFLTQITSVGILTAVIIRRKPSKRFNIISWDTDSGAAGKFGSYRDLPRD